MISYSKIRREVLSSYVLIFMILLITSCGESDKTGNKEVILAKIGDKTITLSEFLNRSEMSIRPAYCNGDNNIHKKIILNSLIAEKMLALEAGEIEDLDQRRQFQLYIQGRQEQAMREWLVHKEGFEKVQLEESEIQDVLNVAGRTYDVQYFNIANDSIAAIIRDKILHKKETFKALYQKLWFDEDIPQRKVSWESQEHRVINESLFSPDIDKGSIIGPLRIGEGNYIVMKVLGWTDQLTVSENARKERRDEVKKVLTKNKALKIYEKFVLGIMEGRKLDFDRETFNQIVKLIGPLYMRSPEDKRELFLNATFNRKGGSPELDHLANGIEAILDNPLLRIEDQVWTVRDFKEELQRHPLVFRKNLPDDTKFAEHFRLAIVDMIRDKYLTQEAYRRAYDKADVVKRTVQMWHDALLAQHQKNQYLLNTVSNPSDSINVLSMIEDYLNPYIDQLQKKYNDQVSVNVEQFNNIKLSNIDMIVIQTNLPFPKMVPGFPQLTTDSKLDYGKKLE